MTVMASAISDEWQTSSVPPLNTWLGDGPLAHLIERAVQSVVEENVAPGAPALRWACWPSADLPLDVDEFLATLDISAGFPLARFQVTTPVVRDGLIEEATLPLRCDHCGRMRSLAGDGSALPMAVVPVSTGRLIVLVGLCWPCVDDFSREALFTVKAVAR